MYQYTPSSLPNTRIDAADILRGFAIGGIVIIHFLEHMNFYKFPELTELAFYYMNLVTVSRLQRNPTVKTEIQIFSFIWLELLYTAR